MSKKDEGVLWRLDKLLASAGLGSRSQVKNLLRQGKVLVNGKKALRPELKVNIEQNEICVDGKKIEFQKYRYVMLHKPAGVITATKDQRQKTVLELISPDMRKNLFPVGRLDKDTVGLLLLTNDGDLAHQMLSPAKHVDKVYEALVAGCVDDETCQAFATGMDIGDEKRTLPAKLEILEKRAEGTYVRVTIQEGRFHQIKRMFQKCGAEVLTLKRLSMGPIVLDENLQAGTFRSLTAEEITQLKEALY